MSAFDKRVRAWRAAKRDDPMLDVLARAIALGNSESELVERAALAARAFEIKQERNRADLLEQTGRKRAVVASFAADHGAPVDEHGRVRRSHARHAVKDATRGATGGPTLAAKGPLPPEPDDPSTAPEQARRASGLIVAGEGSLQEHIRAAHAEREVRGDA